jgi:hypothetical protein
MASLAVPLVRKVVSGVDAIKAAAKLLQRNRDLWPYTWVFPPPDSKRVHQEGTLNVNGQAAATAIQVLAYRVQNNYQFMLNGVVLLYIGNGVFTPGDGNIVFGLDVNVPVGVTSLQGYPVQGFDNSGIPKGAYSSGVYAPYPLAPKPEVIGPADTLRAKVTLSAPITASVGRVIAIFDGWLLPLGTDK